MESADKLLTSELEAMAVIARVLGTLPDDSARQRVLRWACERFQLDALNARSSSSALLPNGVFAEVLAPADDPALKLDSLEDMFQMAAPSSDGHDDLVIADPARKAPDTAKQPVEAVLRSFVAEFQRFAEEWSGATA